MNPYTILLAAFTIGGLLTTIWGWTIVAKARRMKRWPATEGVIEESSPSSDVDEMLPHILFRYTVEDGEYRQVMEFPGSVTPTREFAESYAKKYPVGATVQVYYDPARPGHATLEPGLGRGDWMIFVLGLGAAIFGILFFLFGRR